MLILERKEGEVVFGGFDIDPQRMAETFDHRFEVDEISMDKWRYGVELTIESGNLSYTKWFVPQADPLMIAPDVFIRLLSVGQESLARGPTMVCRLGFAAPASYRLLRDNINNMDRRHAPEWLLRVDPSRSIH